MGMIKRSVLEVCKLHQDGLGFDDIRKTTNLPQHIIETIIDHWYKDYIKGDHEENA